MDDQEYRDMFPIGTVPKNYSVIKDAVGSVVLNFVEGLAITAVFGLLFNAIPFVKVLKISLIVITFIIVVALEFKGSHDYTLITSLAHYIKWKKTSKKYVLGTAETKPEKNTSNFKDIKKTVFEKLKIEELRETVKGYETKAKEKLSGNSKH